MKSKIPIYQRAMYCVLFVGMHCLACSLKAQCIYSPVIAKAYFQHNCDDKSLQNLVGADIPIYGNIGSLYFTSPLTDHVIISNTEDKSINHLRIYPNPAFDFVSIEWPHLDIAYIFFYSQIGQLISNTSIEAYSISMIDIQHLKPGYYIVKAITSTKQIFISKLIKQ
jgi:Secretion system C-terminal sorting domain